MATYQLTNYQATVKLLDVGPPFGEIPVIAVKILDPWIYTITTSDSIQIPLEAQYNFLRVTAGYPCAVSPGGKYNDYIASEFSSYTYPVTSTSRSEKGTEIEVRDTYASSRDALDFTIRMYDPPDSTGNAKYQLVNAGNRNDGRVGVFVVYHTDNFMIRCTGNNSIDCLHVGDPTPNSFDLCDNYKNSGLAVSDVSACSVYSQSALTKSVNSLINSMYYTMRDTPAPSVEPYGGAGDSEAGGGDGTFDYSGNPPGDAGSFVLPNISAADTGFVTLYNPTMAQLKQLSNYLWSSSFDLNTFKKIVNDPMDLFLGLSILPVLIPSGGMKEVGVGLVGTGVYMPVASSQWVKVSCGSVDMSRLTGSYLDYDPYTTVEIYLPYIGVRTLKADEVIGKKLTVTYNVDILSGACIAWIDINYHCMYVYMGQCATSVPIVSGDWTNLINGILNVAGSAIGGAVKGGVGGAIAGGVAAAASVAVNDGKISVERSGNISSAGGLLAPKRPFLIVSSPRICKPKNQHTFEGYPSYITAVIENCSGYLQIEVAHIKNIRATDEEMDEIKSLLLSGVIV